eukprot:899114_1
MSQIKPAVQYLTKLFDSLDINWIQQLVSKFPGAQCEFLTQQCLQRCEQIHSLFHTETIKKSPNSNTNDMGSSQATTNQNNTNSTSQVLPPSKYSAESINFIPVTVPMSNYIISMISRIQGFFHGSDTNENVPNYSKTIKQRLEHFNNIQANICEKKYKNIGEILKDFDGVWKSMYELTIDQTQHNKQHDPKSDFITFAAGIESEFYHLWDQFEQLLIKQGYLNKEVILSSQK